MKTPKATYRIQLSPDFSFDDLKKITGYLHDLGVSTIYAAPFFQSREGSTHGYDIIDPFKINDKIGSLEEFKELRQELRKKNMTWLQDIVPNHMAFDPENVWLKDIFELGPNSSFYHFFDINWKQSNSEKVMAPFLGQPLEKVLKNKELQIVKGENCFVLKYYDNEFPLSARSYISVLPDQKIEWWEEKFRKNNISGKEWKSLKNLLFKELEQDPAFRSNLDEELGKINASEGKLIEILDLQYFRPTYWKKTEKFINYRRFFTINDLICLRMEDPEVFSEYHKFIKELVEQELVDGLRIDHIDGLFDPAGYLQELRNLLGNDFYIIAEKILEKEENLPSWPLEGTTGYEFLAQVNQLMTISENEAVFTENYERIAPKIAPYEEMIYRKKLFILQERMGGELENLWFLLKGEILSEKDNFKEEKLKEALYGYLAAFPVYRIYPSKYPLTDWQEEIIETAFARALEKFSSVEAELSFLRSVFTGKAPKEKEKMLYFLQRCQQFTGPLAAKGGEDTSFYIYNRLVSHNEVGDSPENFGISITDFHQKMKERKEKFPFSINATATHDTKRGEDARMRLNVLSEIPEEWFQKVKKWTEINEKFKKAEGPDKNEEYLIYQTLLAAMPFEEEVDFFSRTTAYLQKVLREAKVHSTWSSPNETYEQQIFDFVSGILKNKDFRREFDPFQQKTAYYGAIKSLAQNILKITAPGVPDVYQGTELWDLNYVDPDNRRPVDYEFRRSYLTEVEDLEQDKLKSYLSAIKTGFSSGKIKFYSLHKLLQLRNDHFEVFEKGEYLPLEIEGKASGKMLTFARKYKNEWIIIIIPLVVTEIFEEKEFRMKNDFSGSKILIPGAAPQKWKNIFTGEKLNFQKGIALENIFSGFPVVCLKSEAE